MYVDPTTSTVILISAVGALIYLGKLRITQYVVLCSLGMHQEQLKVGDTETYLECEICGNDRKHVTSNRPD